MTKVEIDGKTYCVETLIYTVERLTKEVKASAEYHRLVLDKIRAEIESMDFDFGDYYDHTNEIIEMVCKVFDKYKAESEDKE